MSISHYRLSNLNSLENSLGVLNMRRMLKNMKIILVKIQKLLCPQ